jgi:hypothetical protein
MCYKHIKVAKVSHQKLAELIRLILVDNLLVILTLCIPVCWRINHDRLTIFFVVCRSAVIYSLVSLTLLISVCTDWPNHSVHPLVFLIALEKYFRNIGALIIIIIISFIFVVLSDFIFFFCPLNYDFM